MANILLHAHSGWRYVVIIVAIVTFIKLLAGMLTGGRWSRLDQQLSLAFLIVLDVQLLLGLVLWIMEQRWTGTDPLRSWEHPITMILAVAATHMTWSRLKRSNEEIKYRIGVIGFGVASLLIALGVLRITGVL
jgi:hypothetical protein